MLVEDDDPLVRAEAISSMLHRTEHDPATISLADFVLERAVTDPGTTVARNLVGAITRSTTITPTRRTELLQQLAEHRLATLRAQAIPTLAR